MGKICGANGGQSARAPQIRKLLIVTLASGVPRAELGFFKTSAVYLPVKRLKNDLQKRHIGYLFKDQAGAW